MSLLDIVTCLQSLSVKEKGKLLEDLSNLTQCEVVAKWSVLLGQLVPCCNMARK